VTRVAAAHPARRCRRKSPGQVELNPKLRHAPPPLLRHEEEQILRHAHPRASRFHRQRRRLLCCHPEARRAPARNGNARVGDHDVAAAVRQIDGVAVVYVETRSMAGEVAPGSIARWSPLKPASSTEHVVGCS
jgi:hypothetical protein